MLLRWIINSVALILGVGSIIIEQRSPVLYNECIPLPPPGITAKIVNGNVTMEREKPWMVLVIDSNSSSICSGSLFKPDWVMLAAHCLENRDFVKLSFGRTNYTSHGESRYEQIRNATLQDFHLHPNYQGVEALFKHDIALIKISPVIISDRVRPICLPTASACEEYQESCENIELAGWGKTDNGLSSEVLLEAPMTVVSNIECSSRYGFEILENFYLCALHRQRETDVACNGDSGAPLVCKQGRYNFAIGVLSFGIADCDTRIPGVYTNICTFIQWIQNTIASPPISTTTEANEINACNVLPPIANGKVAPYFENGKLVFKIVCDPAFELNGQSIAICQNTWTIRGTCISVHQPSTSLLEAAGRGDEDYINSATNADLEQRQPEVLSDCELGLSVG